MYFKSNTISKTPQTIMNNKNYETYTNSYQIPNLRWKSMSHILKRRTSNKVIKKFRRKTALKNFIKKSLSTSMLSDSVTSYYTTVETKRSSTRFLNDLNEVILNTKTKH